MGRSQEQSYRQILRCPPSSVCDAKRSMAKPEWPSLYAVAEGHSRKVQALMLGKVLLLI